ncbi:hypothetical protein [Nannocystis punicea]|uniref:Uncharacterized protein n=1 Tax=Nannocystis punicea TaxID=2995304 RepID=A0ABY7GY88_9BACT|nr:hypothetical protein [Nannocystis poenicansa]WAS91943.1 hypothetical protein O0S08_37660 [Nannocystis poenicansa]
MSGFLAAMVLPGRDAHGDIDNCIDVVMVGAIGAHLATDLCVNDVVSDVYGATPAEDHASVKRYGRCAIRPAGRGGLCAGRVFISNGGLKVYRVFGFPAGKSSGWWSLEMPMEETLSEYRSKNVICKEWNSGKKVRICQLKAGVPFVIGPGQSTDCEIGSLGYSPRNQVWIPKPETGFEVFEGECEEKTLLWTDVPGPERQELGAALEVDATGD